jgi:hypothetical protein
LKPADRLLSLVGVSVAPILLNRRPVMKFIALLSGCSFPRMAEHHTTLPFGSQSELAGVKARYNW